MQVLDNVCGLIDDSVRDLVVLSVYQASLVCPCVFAFFFDLLGPLFDGINFVYFDDSGRLCLGIA